MIKGQPRLCYYLPTITKQVVFISDVVTAKNQILFSCFRFNLFNQLKQVQILMCRITPSESLIDQLE